MSYRTLKIFLAVVLVVGAIMVFSGAFTGSKGESSAPHKTVAVVADGVSVVKTDAAHERTVPDSDYAKIRAQFAGKDVEKVPAHEKVFALTFDGGGDAKNAQRILDLLSAHGITATFFLTGHFMETFPDVAAAIRNSGGEIANHTMTHKDLSTLSQEAVIAEMAGMEQTAKERGVSVVPFFRFPYGAPTKETIALVNGRGYVSVRWTVDSLGWQGNVNGHDAAFVANRVIQKAVFGGIALMHLGAAKDGSTFDADALEQIITTLQQQGYRLIPLSELFNASIIK